MHPKLVETIIKGLLIIPLYYCVISADIACNKMVEVPEPISSVTSSQIFSTDATATSAILGIYSYMSVSKSFFNLSITMNAGKSADELTDETAGLEYNDVFLSNSLTTSNAGNTSLQSFWQPAYYVIFCANSVISGVANSTGMTSNAKIQLAGEAKFIRALCYFYLTNLFGDLPLVVSDDFNQTVLLTKSPRAQVFQQILSDLLDAEKALPGDFASTNGQPVRANKWAAAALLARVYLYLGNSEGADSAASAVINSRQFGLVPLPVVPADGFPTSDSDVFQANSKEAILQLQTSNQAYPYVTDDANYFVPPNPPYGLPPTWLSSGLVGAFESNDLRMLNWVDSSNGDQLGSPYYYYPYKYKINSGSYGSSTLENLTLLRLAELYLIRAEAEANLNQLSAAINDLDTIRARAGLGSLSNSLSQDSVLIHIQQENRIEFFGELGHRWFDLKRWGLAISTLRNIPYKESIDSVQLLYPIPPIELQDDPNLTQNPGYQQN